MGWTAQQRFYAAVSGSTPDRVPTLPKIWVDLAAKLTGTDLRRLIADPLCAMHAVVDAAMAVGADGARLFHLPRRRTRSQGGRLVEVDQQGRPLGAVDLEAGLATRVEDAARIRLEDPHRVAFLPLWSTPEPLVRSLADAGRIAVPDRSFYEESGFGPCQRKLLSEFGHRVALLGDCGSATLAFHVVVRGMQGALMDLIEAPRLVHAVMEKGAAIAIEKGKFHVDCGLSVLRLNDSVANMSVISPRHWRQFVLPHMKTVCRELHAYSSDVRIYCHVCGNVLPVVDDILAAGIDCIGPLDPLGGFTCAEIRAAVGDRVPLMGGVDTLSFVQSTPEELLEEARACIEAAGRTGPYILGSGCALPPASKRENLLALSRAAKEHGTRTSGSVPP